MQVKITKRQIDALAPGSIIADEEVKGFVARRLRTGAVSYGFRYRDKKTGKQRWIGLGLHGSITPDQARNLAKKRAGEVADARDPAGERDATRAEAVKAKLAEVNTVNAVLDNFLKEYVRGSDALRSADQVERAFKVYVRPRIGAKSIYDLQRSDIKTMLLQGEESSERRDRGQSKEVGARRYASLDLARPASDWPITNKSSESS